MNKKGFTLIELLVVIALLGILVGFVTVNVLKVYDRQQGKISKQEQDVIKKAVENVIGILEDCEAGLDDDLLNALGFRDCSSALNQLNSDNGITITLDELKDTGYIGGGNLDKYPSDSEIIITKGQNNGYDINVDDLTVERYLLYQLIKDKNPDLKSIEDDYGTSYYFTGNISNNYLTFANMCWRIVRIMGNNNIKIVLDDYDQECSSSINHDWYTSGTGTKFGFKIENNIYKINYDITTNTTDSLAYKLKQFQSKKLTEKDKNKLSFGGWCLNYSPIHDYTNKIDYDSLTRLKNKNPSLKCSDNYLTELNQLYVGALTGDDVYLAGSRIGTVNKDLYLCNKNSSNNCFVFGLFAPSKYENMHDYIYIFSDSGSLFPREVDKTFNVRPAVILKSNVTTKSSGSDGTLSNPYFVN